MDKKEQILKVISKEMEELVVKRTGSISKQVNTNKSQIIENLREMVALNLAKVNSKQQFNDMGEVKYICFEYLLSSIITRTYDFQFSVYDEGFHINRSGVHSYFSINEIFLNIEEDMLFLVQKAKREIIGIDDYDFEEIRKAYIILLHYRLTTMFIAENIDKIISLKDFSKLKISEPIEIYVGGYMDKMALISTLEE